jgi:DNA-binding XRE family transcriptional regulator
MARTLNQVLAGLPAKRRIKIERRAVELATTLKDLREAFAHTQVDLAQSLGVGQDTISRIERRSDMLLSTLRRYVEAMGGRLELVARFPNRSPLVIEQLATDKPAHAKARAGAKVRRSVKRVDVRAG